MRRFLTVFSVIALVVASFAGAQPARAEIPDINYVRTIGGSGHAGLYAWGMATAIDGTILVGDYNNYIIQRFETDGTFVQSFSGAGDGPGQTRQPYSVAVNPNNGKIYVMDLNANELEVFNADGSYDTTISDERWSYAPRATVNSEGTIYVVDSHNFSPFYPDVIHVHDPDGNWLFDFGSIGSGPGQFGIIRGIAIGPNDEVFLGDSEQRFIHVFSKDGTFLRSFGEPSQFGYDMRGIVVDYDNDWVYVTDASNGEVEKYDMSGNHLMTVGQLGFGPGDLGGPRELTLDGDNNLYVADYSNNRVNVYDTTGAFIGEIPNPPQPPPDGGFNQPEGVAVNNATGDVYVSDTFNNRIQRFTSEGDFISAWGWRGRDDPLAMDYPRGISIDQATGTVWLNNTRSGDIKAYTANGSFVRSFGQQGSETNMFLYSRGIHLGSDGRLYVTDSGNLRLKVMNQFGDLIYERPCGTEASEDNRILMGCTSVTRDSEGNIYAAAVTEHRVYKWNAAGNLVAKWGTTGGGPGQLSAPYGVAVYDGLLYVSEMWNNRISVFDLNGNYQGQFGSRGSGHGQFNSPTAITFDPAGNLYVSDKVNERIEVFSVGGGGGEPDTTPPDGTIAVPTQNQSFSGTIEMSGEATDNVGVSAAQIAIRNRSTGQWWTGGDWGGFTWLETTLDAPGATTSGWTYDWTPSGAGDYGMTVRAVDTSGNLDMNRPWRLFSSTDGGGGPDTVPPDATVTTPTRNQNLPAGPVTFSGVATDDRGVANVDIAIRNRTTLQWWTGTGWGGWTVHAAALADAGATATDWSFEWTPPGAGNYALWVRARDTSGNIDPTKPWVPFTTG